jgi:hypothetical protein
MKYFLDNVPFRKGNTHTHTTQSDGVLAPPDAAAYYAAQGYDFLTLTDHWKTAPESRLGDMLVLSGVELDYALPHQVIHLVGVGTDPQKLSLDRRTRDTQTAQHGIDMIRRAGGCAILAHPAWSLNTWDAVRGLHGLCGAEIFNACSQPPWNARRGDSGSLMDTFAANGLLLNCVAADDSHFYDGEACTAFIQVQAEENTRDAILAGLRAGRFYASQGPAFLQIEWDAERLHVHTSPVQDAVFYSDALWVPGRFQQAGDGAGTHWTYERPRSREAFVRCEITDAQGRRAWSSPICWP